MTVGHCRPLARWNVVSTTASRLAGSSVTRRRRPRVDPRRRPCRRTRRPARRRSLPVVRLQVAGRPEIRAGDPARAPGRRPWPPAPWPAVRWCGSARRCSTSGARVCATSSACGPPRPPRPRPWRARRPGHRPVDPRRARRHHLGPVAVAVAVARRRTTRRAQHGGGHRHDLGGAAVVLVEADDLGPAQQLGQAGEQRGVGAVEPVDGLVRVADDEEVGIVGEHGGEEAELGGVDVLHLVDEEVPACASGWSRRTRRRPPARRRRRRSGRRSRAAGAGCAPPRRRRTRRRPAAWLKPLRRRCRRASAS